MQQFLYTKMRVRKIILEKVECRYKNQSFFDGIAIVRNPRRDRE